MHVTSFGKIKSKIIHDILQIVNISRATFYKYVVWVKANERKTVIRTIGS